MNKKLIPFLLAFLCSSCSTPRNEIFSYRDGETINNSIVVASDLHYLSQSFLDPNKDYDVEDEITDGRTITYNNYLADRMIDTTIELSPNLLILTGDLAHNGEKTSHQELVSKLSRLNQEGIDVLSTPGNHDLNNYRTFTVDGQVDLYTPEDFKDDYFSLFDNDKAVFDSSSLSYIYHLGDKIWLLMLDSAMYENNNESDGSSTLGYIRQETIDWMEPYLKHAKENSIKVIGFSHHNLINHHPNFTTFYDIYNKEEIIKLYEKYNISLHFSGHLHIQNISHNKNKKIHDIATNSLTIYGNQIGLLELGNKATYYQTKKVTHKGISFDFDQYSLDLFVKRYQKKILNTYRDNFDNEEDNLLFTEYVAKINAWSFEGSLKDKAKEIKENPFYKILRQNKNTYFEYLFEHIDDNHQWLIKNN